MNFDDDERLSTLADTIFGPFPQPTLGQLSDLPLFDSPVFPNLGILQTVPPPPPTEEQRLLTKLEAADADFRSLLSPGFDVEVTETKFVPEPDDSALTFANAREERIRCKLIRTCVLYVDMRNSTSLSAHTNPIHLAKIYSAYLNAMIDASQHFGGKVRGIVGDRVMVLFDSDDCFRNSIVTAYHLNTLGNVHLSYYQPGFSCGIGIDYGDMLVTKVGEPRRGVNRDLHRSLTWLGNPANMASKLTDIAGTVAHPTADSLATPRRYQPILASERVLFGFRNAYPYDQSVKIHLWQSYFNDSVFGTNLYFSAIDKVIPK